MLLLYLVLFPTIYVCFAKGHVSPMGMVHHHCFSAIADTWIMQLSPSVNKFFKNVDSFFVFFF